MEIYVVLFEGILEVAFYNRDNRSAYLKKGGYIVEKGTRGCGGESYAQLGGVYCRGQVEELIHWRISWYRIPPQTLHEVRRNSSYFASV